MTTTSRERREAIAAAIRRAQYRWVRMETHTDILSEAMADAALSVCLPDRETLTLALARLAKATYDDGMHGRAVPSYAANLDHVLSLVYGDDAQAGDQEGAEHE